MKDQTNTPEDLDVGFIKGPTDNFENKYSDFSTQRLAEQEKMALQERKNLLEAHMRRQERISNRKHTKILIRKKSGALIEKKIRRP